jgi:hypothetical protein
MINFMLIGVATPNVFDGNQDVGGMVLPGVQQQNDIGFLSYIESLRYLEVGFFLKNPRYPIWVLGSETHLTVLFSLNTELVAEENAYQRIKRMFSKYDTNNGGFISVDSLQSLLYDLQVPVTDESLQNYRAALDNEGIGIILIHQFMSLLFPNERDGPPRDFQLYHYNGIARPGGTVYVHTYLLYTYTTYANSHARVCAPGQVRHGHCAE